MITSEWEAIEEAVIEEMNRRCALPGQDDDHMRYDDTQIGIEFAFALLRDRFSTAALALLPGEPATEPYGYAFQHEETGHQQVVDVQQVEWGFEKNNPRWQKLGAVYLHPAVQVAELADYDAGLLNDFGGGNIEWWQDYVRAEIGNANDFWREQVSSTYPTPHLSSLADAELQSTADSRIAELEQQIANIKASRDLQVTIAADEEERARKAEADRDQWKNRSDNHWETLRSIREIARTSGDLERIVLWVNDAGSGYTATAEATLAETIDRAIAAEARIKELEERYGLR